MSANTNCPPANELRQLLDGSLSNDRQEICTQHMDSCTCCQAKLEDLATDGTNLSSLVERLADDTPSSESAYWPALKALDAAVQQTVVPRTTPRARDVSLSFLQPATDVAYLGRMAHFDVMRVIGRGGMGLVLEAFDSRLQRNVALKVLDPELAGDNTARQRFCREARAAASITHENVVAVHQVEHSGVEGLPYLVMQLIAGETLEQRLAGNKKLPIREVVRIGMQAAHGLEAAYAQGLIHRDIKPGNILLESPQDRVKLTDFGLARAIEDVKLTHTGFVSGTPLYMAPEQAMGEDPDHRSDLFSLGSVLYEMCAGQPPFTGNSALAILKQIADKKHRPLQELNPDVPDWLARTIDQLLAKRPEDRIQSATHLAELFEFEWALMKTTSEDVPTVCQVAERKRTQRMRWVLAAIGATFLAVGLLVGYLLSNRQGAATPLASTAAPVAVLSANSGSAWSVSFDRASRLVAMGVEDGSVRLWDLPTTSVKSTINAHRGTVWVSQFARNGEVFATSGDDGLIKLWNVTQPEPVQVFQHPKAVKALVFGHDDQQVFAADRDGNLRVWTVGSDTPLVAAQQPGSVNTMAIAPNDETLATAGSDKVVRLWNTKTLAQKLLLEGHSGPVFGLSFSPTGRQLASVGWDKTIRIWDAGSGLLIKSWEGHDSDIWSVAYATEGKLLATAGTDGAVKLWNPETGELQGTYLGHNSAVHTVAFNQDSSLLASGGRDGAVRVWKMK